MEVWEDKHELPHKNVHNIKMTMSGTFELGKVAQILTAYKHTKNMDINDAIWNLIMIME